uniref:Uncharacterized protein n=1 Tax=Physcomitrium patens TaxID=3218 RepID=A0A2K1JIE6_PHYPA|nr:hypothetical protein PHYPA_018479 [Physcomitrium patens]
MVSHLGDSLSRRRKRVCATWQGSGLDMVSHQQSRTVCSLVLKSSIARALENAGCMLVNLGLCKSLTVDTTLKVEPL